MRGGVNAIDKINVTVFHHYGKQRALRALTISSRDIHTVPEIVF